MDFGLYEKLLDSEVKNQISELHNETREVDKSESARVLATAYYKILRKILSEKKDEEKIDFVKRLNKEIGNDVLFSDDKKELKIALSKKEKDDDKKYVFFDLRPFSHQKEILEDLRLEREEYGSNKNLVVAATGAGKTVSIPYRYYKNFFIIRPTGFFQNVSIPYRYYKNKAIL